MAAWVALQGSSGGSEEALRAALGKPGASARAKPVASARAKPVDLDSKPADSDKPEDSGNSKVALANSKAVSVNKADSVVRPGAEHFPGDSVERESRGEQEFFPITLANL